MKLTSIEIKKQEFKKSMRGYDVSEVEAYLDTVANSFESMQRELEQMKEQVNDLTKDKEELDTEIHMYRDNEKTFQKAIVKSQDMAEQIIDSAQKRAELIVKEAEIMVSRSKLESQEGILILKQELEELRIKNETIIDDIKNYLIDKLNSIEEYSRNRKIFRMEQPQSNMKAIEQEEKKPYDLNLNVDESN